MSITLEFDLDRCLRNSRRVDLTSLDWHVIPDHPLSDGDTMSMPYMIDIEMHTVIYLRDLDIAEIAPGFAGLRLLEDALDTALKRASARAGYAGTVTVPSSAAPRPGTAGWAPSKPYAQVEPYVPRDSYATRA